MVKIPKNVFEKFTFWMVQGPWPYHLQERLDAHFGEYCDRFDLDTFEQVVDHIGAYAMSNVREVAFYDFLTRETDDGAPLTAYLKKRSAHETAIGKAYMRGVEESRINLYEVVETNPGVSFLARDLLFNADQIEVSERTASKTLSPGDHIGARLVQVKGEVIIAGAILAYSSDYSAKLRAAIETIAREAGGLLIQSRGAKAPLDPETLERLSRFVALTTAPPLFSSLWLEQEAEEVESR